MKESATYQAIVEEGRIEGRMQEAQAMVLRIGRKFLGSPDEETETAIRSIGDLERLSRMAEGASDVKSWSELLAIA